MTDRKNVILKDSNGITLPITTIENIADLRGVVDNIDTT